jgi:hypothetical protein
MLKMLASGFPSSGIDAPSRTHHTLNSRGILLPLPPHGLATSIFPIPSLLRYKTLSSNHRRSRGRSRRRLRTRAQGLVLLSIGNPVRSALPVVSPHQGFQDNVVEEEDAVSRVSSHGAYRSYYGKGDVQANDPEREDGVLQAAAHRREPAPPASEALSGEDEGSHPEVGKDKVEGQHVAAVGFEDG